MTTLQATVFDNWDKTKTTYNRKTAEQWVKKEPISETAEGLLTWASQHPFLRVNTNPVPKGIFPEGVDVTLSDIVTSAPKRRRGGKILDDDIYDAFPKIRTYVPRGCCILHLKSEKESFSKIVVFAMKKFTGGPGDDDDMTKLLEEEEEHGDATSDVQKERERWEFYFAKKPEESKYILNTSKENGEAAHLSQFRYDNVQYYIFGSKNVHLIVKEKQDLKKYTAQRYMTALMIAEAMKDQIMDASNQNMTKFLDHLHDHDRNACFEFLNVAYQHVEFFDFEKSKYRFITFCENQKLTTMCSNNFEQNLEFARSCGLETTTSQRFPIEQQDELFKLIRRGYGKEGSVLYYFDESDQCIGMMKKKTAWYVCVRAIREKIRSYSFKCSKGEDSEAKANSVKKRLKVTIAQKQNWIGFSDQCKQDYINLALPFVDYIKQGLTNKKFNHEQVHEQYPVVWNKFLKEKKLSDEIDCGV
ncbi:ATP-dependent RNA helicase [Acrasis kona]|uniref:ATP-dependent RNA helicase n=1 Tax=Acrasis kona TaxID=1008807 RepID=A0AAW2ZRW9_9EUKA